MARSINHWQHVIVASLVGHCEAIISSGRLTEPNEESLRVLVAEALSAFGMVHNNNQEAA